MQISNSGCNYLFFFSLRKKSNRLNESLDGILLQTLVSKKLVHDYLICENNGTGPGYSSCLINPFQANVPFLYPLKTSENLWFSDVFRGYRKGTLA